MAKMMLNLKSIPIQVLQRRRLRVWKLTKQMALKMVRFLDVWLPWRPLEMLCHNSHMSNRGLLKLFI